MYFADKYGYKKSDDKIGTAQEPLKDDQAAEPKQDSGFFASKYGYADERDLEGIIPAKPKEQNEQSDDGFLKDSFQSLAGGGLDAVEQYARASRAVPGGAETYNLNPDSKTAKTIDWVNKVKAENPDYDLDEKREGLSRWYHEGLRAMVPSLAGGLPGAAAGATLGTAVGGPVGTFLGGLTGFALGAGGVFGAAEYDSFMEEAQQAGVPEEEAHQMGVLSGIAEGGFEAATDLLQGATLGVGKLATAPAKQALKKGVSELFKMRFGNMLGRSVGGAAIEGTGEAATAATQTQLRKKLGMSEMSAMDAAAQAFGPGFMMGLMFTPMVQYTNYQGKKADAFALAREDSSPEARKKAAERIGKQLGKYDDRAERYWMKYADEAIKNKEPIRLDMDYDNLNERINNLEASAQYSDKAKENLEILKDQKELIDAEEKKQDKTEVAKADDYQETTETEDYTREEAGTTLADFDLGQPVDRDVVSSEMEQTTEQTAQPTADVAIEAGQSQRSESANDYISEPLSTPEMDERDSTYTNAPIEETEASQEPVQETSLLDVRDEDLEIIDGTEEELGNYNIVGPSKKPGQGYKKLDAAKNRAQKLRDEGAESYLMKNRDGEYLVISDRKYAEAKEEPVPLRKDQVETEIRTEIGNQFDTLQKRGLIEIVDNETDAKGEPIYANGSDKPAGYYENGKVTLISSGIGKGQAYNVFMHEGVHKILDKNPSFSKRKKGLFNEFKNLKDTENIKAAYGVVPKDTPTQNIDEEAFAYFIQNENNRDHSLYRKVVATVKSYLNKLGIPYTKLNDKDIAALAVKQINRDMNKQVSSADRKYSKVAGSDQKQTEYDSNAQTMADVLGQKDNVKRPERPAEPQTPSNPTVGTDNKGFKLTIDKFGKDQGKADIANAFIGYGHTRRNTSTGQYLNDAENQGIPTNENINPDNNTIAFVSVASEGINNDKTIAQAQRVLDAGGYIVMDSKGTGKGQSHSSFNKNGEGAVQDALTEQYGEPQKSKNGYSVYKKRATVSDKKEAPKQPDLTFADKPVQTEKTVSIKNEVEASNTAVTTAGNLGRSIPKEDYKYNQVVAIVEGADNADEVVLFGELNDDQTLPKGLGAWAAQTAINQRTPVYFFDNKQNKWFIYNKGRAETPESIEAQKRETIRETAGLNNKTYELLPDENDFRTQITKTTAGPKLKQAAERVANPEIGYAELFDYNSGETVRITTDPIQLHNSGAYKFVKDDKRNVIPKQEEIVDGFIESIPPRIPTDNTFLYADSKYIDQGNVKQAISYIETEETNRADKDKMVPLPPSIDAEVNSPSGKQAQLKANSENTIREMKRDFYGARGDSDVADNMDADQMDTELGLDPSEQAGDITIEQQEQLDEDAPKNKRSSANVADIVQERKLGLRDDNINSETIIEKPQMSEGEKLLADTKKRSSLRMLTGTSEYQPKTDTDEETTTTLADLIPAELIENPETDYEQTLADFLPDNLKEEIKQKEKNTDTIEQDKFDFLYESYEGIKEDNYRTLKKLYNEMVAAKDNKYLNTRMGQGNPQTSYKDFTSNPEVVLVRDYIISQLQDIANYYDLSAIKDYFANNPIGKIDTIPEALDDLLEDVDNLKTYSIEENYIQKQKGEPEFEYDVDQAQERLMSDGFDVLLNSIKQDNPDAPKEFAPIFGKLFSNPNENTGINSAKQFFEKNINPLIDAATEDATNEDGSFSNEAFINSDGWTEAKKKIKRQYRIDVNNIEGGDRILAKVANFISKDIKSRAPVQLIEPPADAVYKTEEYYLDSVFPLTPKEKKESKKTTLERKTDKVKTADRASEYIDLLVEGMKSWGFKDYRHIKLNVNNAVDALIMMKNPALLKDFQNASFEGVINSLNDKQKEDALRIIENSIPNAKIVKLRKELNKPADKQNFDGVFGSMQNKFTARDIAGAVKSEYFKGEKGKRFKQFGPYDRLDIAKTMLQSMKIVNDIWEKPIFGHGLIAETVEELDQAQIDDIKPDNRIGRTEDINTKSTIAYADNYGYVQNFDYNEKAQDVAGLVETLGIASEQEIHDTLTTLEEAEFKDPARKEAENRVQEWKIELAKRSISSGLFINSGKIDELAKKYLLDKNKVKRTWLTSIDTPDFYRKVDNLIDETHLETAKRNVSKRLGNTDNIIEKDLNKRLTDGFDKKQLQAYYSGKKYIGDKRKQMAVKAAVQLRDEILLRGKGKARIEEIKLSNEQEVKISDVVELREATDFDKQFTREGALPVRMLNQDKQAAYEDISKAFGAELALISDARFDETTGKLRIRSRYIPATEDSPSQFVINIKDKRPFDNLFSDMVADHAINSMTAAQVKRLNGRAKRTSIQNKYGNEFDRTVSEQAEKKGDFFDKNARMDAISELVANVISNKQTLNDIASTYEGRADLAAILKGVTETIDKLDNPISRTRGLDADTIGAFSKYSFEEYRKFIVEMFVDEDVMARGHDYQNMTSTEPRMYSMNGFYSIADAQEMLKQVKQGGKDQVKKITQDNRGTKVAIMDAVEKWLKNAVLWIKKHKPKGFIDDLLADPLDMELASMVQHAGEERLAYLRSGVIAKHKDTFKQYSITELEQMHDRIRRGIKFNDKGVGEKVDNGLDFTKEEDRNKALEEGISQEVIDAFIDFKKEADRQYQELRKVYPDLPEDPVHYGQSIRWRYKDGRYVNEEFDHIVKPELEGSDYYTKEKDKSRTTAEIAEKYQYKSINPTTMLLDYVAETEKIIATRKMLNRAMAEGRAKIFTNRNEFKKGEWHEVDDDAFQNVLNHQTENQYEIELNGNPYLDESGGRIFFKTVAEAEETAKELDGITSVKKRESLDKALVGWTIYENSANGLIEVGAVNDMPYAQDIVNKMKEAGVDATMKPRFESSQKTTLAQTYFSEDLARMLRTTVSPNKFRNMKLGPLSGHSLLQFKHASTAIEFAFSFFHAFTISQEAMASEMSTRQRRASTLSEKIKASNPFSALGGSLSDATDIKVLIDEVMKNPEMVHDQAVVDKIGDILHVENPDVADMIHQFFNVGGLFKMDKNERHQSHYFGEMRYLKNLPKMEIINGKAEVVKGKNSLTDVAKTMVASIAETRDSLVKQYPDNKVASMFKTAQFTALEGPTAWLMETGIPKLKMATWMKEYSKNLETNREKLLNGEISKMSIAHDTMKFVEDRFGEVNWKNQWMNKGTKDALIFMFRSFTWFTGSWKGVTKAGVDYGKLGWYKLKGEKYELTTKGLWGVNAVIAHFLTAAAVTAVYQAVYGWDDPAPDDEETDLLTKLMFPRHDPQDPHSRLTIPSYVTEAYKIFHHIGLMGDHTEPWKLVSGRFNSFIGNAWEAFDGKSWDGVVVRDNSESLPTQALDSALHIINIAPISISSAFSNAARKGFDPTTTALSLMGMTRAPAVSLHSDAVNKAYQISREQFAGLSKKPGEKKLMEERSRAAYQFGKGNKKPLQDMLKEGRISRNEYENSIKNLRYIDGKKNPLYVDELSSALKRLTIEQAIEVWNYMSDAEKKKHRVEMVNKYRNVVKRGTRPKQEIGRIRQELKVSGIF